MTNIKFISKTDDRLNWDVHVNDERLFRIRPDGEKSPFVLVDGKVPFSNSPLRYDDIRTALHAVIDRLPIKDSELKRDYWTTDEVIEILKGRTLENANGEVPEGSWCEHHNWGVESCIEEFAAFKTPLDQMGAMAYSPEKKEVFHVGYIPEDAIIKVKHNNEQRDV